MGHPDGSDAGGHLYFNGIDGATGQYLLPSMAPDAVAKIARGERLDPQEAAELRARYVATHVDMLGPVAGVDLTDLAQSGWGVIFAGELDPAVHDALKPLLDARREQASAVQPGRYREYAGPDGHRPGESSLDFRVRHGIGAGQPTNPDKMPYYLMIVGDPVTIPYRFQYQLDVRHAVGRVHFDAPEEYATYAQAVVGAESNGGPARKAAFFGVRNPDDRATTMSADSLVTPLSRTLSAEFPEWTMRAHVGEEATKARVEGLLGGAETPALFFSASHGMAFPNGHPLQLRHQGALLCQDWPGPLAWRKAITEDLYFSGDDVSDEARPSGLVALLFACYGAGTPQNDDFVQQALGRPTAIAPHDFLSHLPRRLLGHPRGGALAVVGHVERTWSYSFMWPGAGEQLGVFTSTLGQLMKGVPVGAAVEFFNDWYAALNTELDSTKEEIDMGGAADPVVLSGLWTARNDSRNYVILGDPAVRLRV
jgi:hypothetical protein